MLTLKISYFQLSVSSLTFLDFGHQGKTNICFGISRVNSTKASDGLQIFLLPVILHFRSITINDKGIGQSQSAKIKRLLPYLLLYKLNFNLIFWQKIRAVLKPNLTSLRRSFNVFSFLLLFFPWSFIKVRPKPSFGSYVLKN